MVPRFLPIHLLPVAAAVDFSLFNSLFEQDSCKLITSREGHAPKKPEVPDVIRKYRCITAKLHRWYFREGPLEIAYFMRIRQHFIRLKSMQQRMYTIFRSHVLLLNSAQLCCSRATRPWMIDRCDVHCGDLFHLA